MFVDMGNGPPTTFNQSYDKIKSKKIPTFMKFTLMSRQDSQSQTIVGKLLTKLLQAGHRQDDRQPDVLIFIGGDGTFLRSLQAYLPVVDSLVFVGIHTGTLGFFCEYYHNQLDQIVNDLPTMKKRAERYPLIELNLIGKKSQRVYAVNEVRIENPFHTFVTDVYIDDHPLQTFRGTGLIVASTLGSSAYNKSLGGALVDVQIPSLQLTEMATIQNNAYRSLGSSLVLDANRLVTLKGDFTKAIFGYDHVLVDVKETVEEVQVRLSKKMFRLFHQKQHPYFETLRKTFVRNG
jgi:NAD+ kinase